MEQAPRLIIIAEYGACSTTQEWIHKIHAYANLLPQYPTVALQLRAKDNPSVLQRVVDIMRLPQVFVNTSIEHAQILCAQALHLPQKEIPHDAPHLPFGISIHNPLDARMYQPLNPLYLQLGPIYHPISKEGQAKGLALFHATRETTIIPIIAVGGITPQRAQTLRSQGCWGVASIGYAMQHDPEETILALL